MRTILTITVSVPEDNTISISDVLGAALRTTTAKLAKETTKTPIIARLAREEKQRSYRKAWYQKNKKKIAAARKKAMGK